MKWRILFYWGVMFSIAAVSNAAANGHHVNSALLKHPGRCIDLIADHADFYALTKDDENGGFYNYIDREGNPIYPDEFSPDEYWYWHWYDNDPDSWLKDEVPYSEFSHHLKGVSAQSRLAYVFVRAFQTTGDESYLTLAEDALDFLYEAGWDDVYDGWLFTTDEYGEMAPWMPGNWWDPNYFKWGYEQMYPLVGIGAMVEATGGDRSVMPMPNSGMDAATDLDWLLDAYDIFSENMWDDSADYMGYFMYSSNILTDGVMWADPRYKSFTGVVDAITTHASMLYLTFGDDAYRDRLFELGNEAATRLATSFGHNPWGFVTEYDSEWNPGDDPLNGSVSVGHMLKTAWVLARVYLLSGDPQHKAAAKSIIQYVYENGGYDHVNGAVYDLVSWETPVDEETGQPLPDGETVIQYGPEKIHWGVEQGVLSGLLNWVISDDADDRAMYLDMADGSLDFFEKYFVDYEYGGSWFSTDAEGNVLNENAKADLWEAGYHSTELLYYTYLYVNLLHKKSSASLYYYFEPQDMAREITLNPIEGCDGRIKIKKVKLNNHRYWNFDSHTRTLRIPAGVGGKFKVTFRNMQHGHGHGHGHSCGHGPGHHGQR